MSHPYQPQTLAVLSLLAKSTALTRLEIERILGIAQVENIISRLRKGLHVAPLPRVKGEFTRYKITNSGREIIGEHVEKQQSLRARPLSELPLYVPSEMPVRAGSMRAYSLPSRGMR